MRHELIGGLPSEAGDAFLPAVHSGGVGLRRGCSGGDLLVDANGSRRAIASRHSSSPARPAGFTPVIPPQPYPSPSLPTFPDPTAPPGSSAQVFIDPQAFDSLIGAATAQFTDKVRDESSLREYREAISHRAATGQGAAPREERSLSISTPRRRWIRRCRPSGFTGSSRLSPCTKGTTTRRRPGSRRRWRCPRRRACRSRSGLT